MSEFGFSFVVLQLLQFFFFLLSHPLYFSYFIFFFPYFLKLLSFLSPLFLTTFLLLFAFFSLFLSPSDLHHFSDPSKMGFLATTYQVVFDSLRPRTPEEIPPMEEELEAYKIVFETYTFGTEQNPYDNSLLDSILDVGIDRGEDFPEKTEEFKTEEKEMMTDLRKGTEESSISSRSESSPWSSPGSLSRESSLGSYGSMRKEKEWRRTLACKLFEERHNSEGTEEGMDSLWERYEKSESSKKLQNQKKKKEKTSGKSKRGKKIEEDEEEEAHLCCLQALKFSAGKTNLVKMTKALKGFGWLSRNGSRKRLIL